MWDMKIEKKYYSSWKVLIHWFHCIARHIIQVAVKDSFIIDYLASDSYICSIHYLSSKYRNKKMCEWVPTEWQSPGQIFMSNVYSYEMRTMKLSPF